MMNIACRLSLAVTTVSCLYIIMCSCNLYGESSSSSYRASPTTLTIDRAKLRMVRESKTSVSVLRVEPMRGRPSDRSALAAYYASGNRSRPFDATLSWNSVQPSSSSGIRVLITFRNTTSESLQLRLDRIGMSVCDAEGKSLTSPFFGGSGSINYASDDPVAAIDKRIRKERLDLPYDIERVFVLGMEVPVKRNPERIEQQLEAGEELGVELLVRRLAADYDEALKQRNWEHVAGRRCPPPGVYSIASACQAGDPSKPDTMSKYSGSVLVRVE